MAIETLVEGAAVLWWSVAITVFALSLFGALLQPRIQRRRATSRETPPISLILPIKIVNPGFERAQRSALIQDYPRYEIIVGTKESESPAVSIMRTLQAKTAAPIRILRSSGFGAVSPKLDTLAAPLVEAAHDLIVTKDSNISFSRDTMRVMVRSLVADVAMVCAVPVAIRAETLAGEIEAAAVNRDARMLLTASALGKGFGVGKVTVFRRSDLERAGGMTAMGYTIAEDSAFAKGFAAIGLRTVFAENTVDQEIGARRLRDVYARQARWAVIRRAEEPKSFAFEPLACPLPAAVAGAFAAPMVGLGAMAGFGLTLCGWFLIELLFTALKRWPISIWSPIAFLGRDGLLLTAWAAAWTTREVTWAGGKQAVRDLLRRPAA